ncbi:photosynthetic reaction center cytochrome PufC [Thiohalocapsa halophila]
MARGLLTAGLACGMVLLTSCKQPTDSVQWGYRGNSMIQVYNPANVSELEGINAIPEPEPSDPYDPSFPMATEVHQNVQVLTDLNALEFARLMNAMTTWIAPDEGCAYCHNAEDLADDSKYTKQVSRQMLKMTRDINANWESHVAKTGVTCWTCHRGEPVPSDIWFEKPEPPRPSARISGWKGDQNLAGVANSGFSSLPFDPMTAFLLGDTDVRVQGTELLPYGNRQSTKQAENTYSLMMYMSQSLGVNCTYCHQTRAMGLWEESTPQRVTAWHGIRMVRDMNNAHLEPLQPLYPEHRLGPMGDAPKAACATCHKGTYKPLYGESMLSDYPSLKGVLPGRLSPDPTEGGTIRIALAPEGVGPASVEERQAFVEMLAAAEAEQEQAETAAADAEAAPAPDADAEPTAAAPAVAAADGPGDTPAAPHAEALPTPSARTASMLAVLGGTDTFAAAFANPTKPSPELASDAAPLPKWQGLWRWWQPPAGLSAEEAKGLASATDVDAALGVDRALASVFSGAATPAGAADAETTPKWQGWRRWQPWLPRQAAAAGALSVDDMSVAEIEVLLADVSGKLQSLRAELQAERAKPRILEVKAATGSVPLAEAAAAEATPAETPAESGDAPQPATAEESATAAAETPADNSDESNSEAAASADSAAMDAETAAVATRSDELEAHAEALATEVETLRDELAAKTEALAEATTTAEALDAAEGRIVAMQARLDQETTALEQQLEVVREQRDAVAEALRDEHADAMDAKETRLTAMQARIDQQRKALDQQLNVVRGQRDVARAEVEERVAEEQHAAALAAAERQINAIEARLDQQTHALSEQLQVVRGQRDEAEGSMVDLVPADEHYDALDAAEGQLAAMGARIDQQTRALNQQLEVVRTQRDKLAERIDDSVPDDEHYGALDAVEGQLAAMGARLDQQTEALRQQLEVVRAQRDAAAAAPAEADATGAAEPTAVAGIPKDEYYDALDTAEEQLIAMGARLRQQTKALHQQLEVVRAQRDGAKEQLTSRVPADAYYDALDTAERDLNAMGARLAQQTQALHQQLEVVREQRNTAETRAAARIPADEHYDAVESLEGRVAAIKARLDQNRHALEQQLDVVRSQRDGMVAAAQARVAALEEEHAEALEALQARIAAGDARQAQESEALRQQLVVVREQRDAAKAAADEEIARLNERLAETREQLGETRGEVLATEEALADARDTAARAEALTDTAAALGGQVTDAGIVVNLGGDRLRFASGSAALPAGELPDLDRTAELLAERPELTARVEGHTDSVGSRAINQSLSQQRAEAVMDALVERGVDPARLAAEGVGPDRPIASNATAAGRSQNRRVEIVVTTREQVATGSGDQ